jgi:hypothetical protein
VDLCGEAAGSVDMPDGPVHLVVDPGLIASHTMAPGAEKFNLIMYRYKRLPVFKHPIRPKRPLFDLILIFLKC